MATTTQDQNRAKFLELRAQGMSVADARDKSYGPAPTTPVAPTTPATPIVPTPTVTPAPVAPTVNVQEQMAGKTVAERQAIRSGTPTTPVTQVPSLIGTKGTVENLPSQLNSTDQATIDRMTAEGRFPETQKTGITQDAFQQAQAESEKIKAQNEAQMKLNTQQADLKAQERQQVAKETAQASIPTDQKGIVNALISGMSVAEQPTQAYRNALVVSNQFKKFNGMTEVQLLDNLKQGQIGTELDSLLSQNPNYAKAKAELAKVQKTASINRATRIASNVISGKETPVVDDLANIEAKYQPPLGANAKAYQDYVVQNPDVVSAGSQVKQLSTQISDLTKSYNDALKSIKSQYGDMPASALLTLMGSRTSETKELLDSYINAKELAKGDFDMAMKMAEGSYGAYTKDREEQQKIASEQRKIQAEKDMMQYEADFNKKQAELALQDPATQIGQTMQEFEKMGITSQGNLASKIAEYEASGKTLHEYISGLRQQFMSKPEYKKIQELQAGQMSDAQKMQATQAFQAQSDIRNFAQQKELARYNNDLNRQEFLFKIENDPEQKAKTAALEAQLNSNKSLFDVLGKNVGTYEGNRGYDLAGALGDPLPAGGNWTVKSIDTAGEQVGSIFIGGKGSKPYGNTVVMVDENGNEVRYSHLQNIGVKPGDVLGFGDIVGTRGNTGNVMGANGEKLTAEQLKAGRGAHLDVEIKNPSGKLLSNADQVNFLKGLKAGATGTNAATLPLYRAYMEENKLPSKDALKGLGMTSEQFTNNADAGYDAFLKTKAKEISDTYPTLDIEYTGNYAGNSATQKEKLNESVTKIGDIDSRISQLKSLFEKNGTEVWATNDKAIMESLRKQIILKAKEVENLGVLNGPDLGILEDLLPSTTGVMSGLFSLDSNTMAKLNNIQNNYRMDAKTKAINYGARLNFQEEPVQDSTTNAGVGKLSPQAQSIEQEWLNR